jgi:hypothetical protein
MSASQINQNICNNYCTLFQGCKDNPHDGLYDKQNCIDQCNMRSTYQDGVTNMMAIKCAVDKMLIINQGKKGELCLPSVKACYDKFNVKY